jgi:hypothetical protein
MKTTVAMWMISNEEAILLAASKGYEPCVPSERLSMLNCSRFVNSDIYFDSKSITVLLRNLEKNKCEEREGWWLDVRSCRRRRQVAIDITMPINTIFHTLKEFEFMEYRATIDRIRTALNERGMFVFDAFRAFNSSNSGLMSCSEFYGGMEFLGIPFTPEKIYTIMRRIAVSNEGLVSYLDFKRVFKVSDEEMETHTIGSNSNVTFESVPPKTIPEISEQRRRSVAEEVVILNASILENFKVKVLSCCRIYQIVRSWCCVDQSCRRRRQRLVQPGQPGAEPGVHLVPHLRGLDASQQQGASHLCMCRY